MLSVALALAGSVIYGASDFFGGLAARGTGAVRVTLINSIAGLAVLVVAALVLPSRWGAPVLLWGVLAGVCGAVALVLLYACLALGPMSILSPILTLVAAVIPITIGFVRGERLSGLGYRAFLSVMAALDRPNCGGANMAFSRMAALMVGGYEDVEAREDILLGAALGRLGEVAYVQGALVHTSARRLGRGWGPFLGQHIRNLAGRTSGYFDG